MSGNTVGPSPLLAWGVGPKGITVSMPETGKILTLQEAVQLAESGDREAVRDVLGIWIAIHEGGTPVKNCPEVLEDYARRLIGRLADGRSSREVLSLTGTGRRHLGREGWRRDLVLALSMRDRMVGGATYLDAKRGTAEDHYVSGTTVANAYRRFKKHL